jgi:hypothetical protein
MHALSHEFRSDRCANSPIRSVYKRNFAIHLQFHVTFGAVFPAMMAKADRRRIAYRSSSKNL